jgi:formate hydrogenlyase subunit 6/NADH:ubiquinone oxidoreductase subunit I
MTMIFELLAQMFKTPATNQFPARHAPSSVHGLVAAVQAGKAKLNPPVPVPEDFRGKIIYNRETCIGCKICINVCPAHAIEFLPENKKVRIFVAQCVQCGQCNDVCPKKCLSMSKEFALADYDKMSANLIVEK